MKAACKHGNEIRPVILDIRALKKKRLMPTVTGLHAHRGWDTLSIGIKGKGRLNKHVPLVQVIFSSKAGIVSMIETLRQMEQGWGKRG